ncbi:hypothetical protein, conserved [Babesia bigemina]|uniref:6-Cys domain-containing protein n=1 Tax=Babesia bigemina TaxID=5866 RepID=A0A061DEN3_BABBI|nr:hypothetical protein, conserved [Babesia bigemina]CDR97580.1 hypothetical protein, conserved [Babesia bigemina]|eukprot:XP_012769766.1 hypothetical protein, conserved [Babesia bigemina]
MLALFSSSPAKCFSIAIFANLLLLRSVSGVDDTDVIKWVGDHSPASWFAYGDSNLGKHHLYFDVDLYRGEHVQVHCPAYSDYHTVLKPLDENMFYNTDAFHHKLNAIDEGGHYHYLSRWKINISEAFDCLTVKELPNEKWTISYLGKPTYLTMETLYFDCIATSDSGTLHTATVKLNIMPEYYLENETEEHIDFNTKAFSPDDTPFTYFKFPRSGSTLHLKCETKGTWSAALKDPYISGTQTMITKETYVINFDEQYFIGWLTDVSFLYCDQLGLGHFVMITQSNGKVLGVFWSHTMESSQPGMLKANFDVKKHLLLNFYCGSHCDKMYPKKIPQEFLVDGSSKLRHDQLLGNLGVIRRSPKSMTLDFSRYYSYSYYEAAWYSNETLSAAHSVIFSLNPACDFSNANSLDMDSKTCSVFLTTGKDVIIRGAKSTLGKLHMLPDSYSLFYWRKVQNPEAAWNEHTFERVTVTRRGVATSQDDHILKNASVVTFTVGTFDSPLYYIWSHNMDDDGKEADKILKVYFAHSSYLVKPDMNLPTNARGNIRGNTPYNSKVYHIVNRGAKGLKFSCSYFFESDYDAEYVLHPQGKNLIYSDVGTTHADLTEIPTVQFHEEFAVAGVSMYKVPESIDNYDFEMKFEPDKIIMAVYKQPLFFICARKDFDKSKHSYLVIGIDPFYQQERIYGCGTRPEFFLNKDGQTNSEHHCEFTLDDDKTVGFFCPMPIPSHFLEGDQKQWAPASDDPIATTNPYKNMVQCYDRTTYLQRLVGFKVDIGMFASPRDVGEVRSLWIFNNGQFIKNGKVAISKVICYCFNTEGRSVASIAVSSHFKKLAT